MSIAEGRNGKITIVGSSVSGDHLIAEMGEWSISGISRNMINSGSFGSVTAKFKPGELDPGTISFNGWYDATDSTGQASLITLLSSGTLIASSSATWPNKLKLWTNDDTAFSGYGFFYVPAGADQGVYITSMDVGTNKDGLASFAMTGKITGAVVQFSTVPTT